jgi:hypothetical protein
VASRSRSASMVGSISVPSAGRSARVVTCSSPAAPCTVRTDPSLPSWQPCARQPVSHPTPKGPDAAAPFPLARHPHLPPPRRRPGRLQRGWATAPVRADA